MILSFHPNGGIIVTLTRGEAISFGSVCPFWPGSLFVFVRTEHGVFSATASRIEKKKFTRVATAHVECFNDNYDIIGHVVWQPCWKKGKTLDLCISETAPWLKIETWNMTSTPPWGIRVIFFLMVS